MSPVARGYGWSSPAIFIVHIDSPDLLLSICNHTPHDFLCFAVYHFRFDHQDGRSTTARCGFIMFGRHRNGLKRRMAFYSIKWAFGMSWALRDTCLAWGFDTSEQDGNENMKPADDSTSLGTRIFQPISKVILTASISPWPELFPAIPSRPMDQTNFDFIPRFLPC
jgi:hypothetical protein